MALQLSSAASLNKMLRKVITTHSRVPNMQSLIICVRKLSNQGLHTWRGIIGYCLKQPVAPPVMLNVSDEDITLGIQRFLEFGSSNPHNRVVLTAQNILGRAFVFQVYRMRDLSSNLTDVLLSMLRSGSYYASPDWAVIRGSGRLKFHAASVAAIWRTMQFPDAVTRRDVDLIFFGDAFGDLGRSSLRTLRDGPNASEEQGNDAAEECCDEEFPVIYD